MRCTSSMKSTSRAWSAVSIAARSPGFLDHRAGRGSGRDAKLVGDHVGQRGLAETGRAVQEHVIERLAALFGRGNRHVQILAKAVLADVLVERPRPEPGLVLDVVVDASGGDDAIGHSFSLSSAAAGSPSTPARTARREPCRSPFDGLLGHRPLIPEIHQRRQQIRRAADPQPSVAAAGLAAGGRRRGSRSFSSSPIRSAVFLPTPGMPRQPRDVLGPRPRGSTPPARCRTAPPAPASARRR